MPKARVKFGRLNGHDYYFTTLLLILSALRASVVKLAFRPRFERYRRVTPDSRRCSR